LRTRATAQCASWIRTYKVLSAIITDFLYRLAKRHGLLVSSQEKFRRLHSSLLLALKATGVGHCTVSGGPVRGFADDLVIVTGSGADMSRLLQVVSDFCAWSRMRIKREKSVATGFDVKSHVALPTEDILYEGVPLTGLAPDEASAYLGVRTGLVPPSRPPVTAGGTRHRWYSAPCLVAEKLHIQAAAKDIETKTLHHQYLLC
jgi:hypothetical protein